MRLHLVTPTYAADIRRCEFLCASLAAAGCTRPHWLVVQTEDLSQFKKLSWPANVELIASADILPPQVEAARLHAHARPAWLRKIRRSFNKRFGVFSDAASDGWHAQQIVKLALAATTDCDVVVSLDSDVIACGDWNEAPLCSDGRGRLQRAELGDDIHAHWAAAAKALLGINAPPTVSFPYYVAHPFSFDVKTTKQLLDTLESRHGRPWWQVLTSLRAGQLSEFTLYGTYADAQSPPLPTAPANSRTTWIFTAQDRSETDSRIAQCFSDPDCDFFVLQASRHWPLAPYESTILDAIAAR